MKVGRAPRFLRCLVRSQMALENPGESCLGASPPPWWPRVPPGIPAAAGGFSL